MTGVPSGIPPDCLRLLLYYKNNTSGSYDKPAESSVALRVAAHGMLANAAAAAIGRRGLQDRAWMEVAGTTPSASGCPTLCSARLWANRRGGGTDDHRHGPVRKPGPARARLPPPALDQEPARPQASAPGHLSDRDMHERRRRPAGRVARTRPAAKAEHLGSQAQPLCSGIPQVRLGTPRGPAVGRGLHEGSERDRAMRIGGTGPAHLAGLEGGPAMSDQQSQYKESEQDCRRNRRVKWPRCAP
jgi:hypothetical protein